MPQSVHFHLQNPSKTGVFLRPNRRWCVKTRRGWSDECAPGSCCLGHAGGRSIFDDFEDHLDALQHIEALLRNEFADCQRELMHSFLHYDGVVTK